MGNRSAPLLLDTCFCKTVQTIFLIDFVSYTNSAIVDFVVETLLPITSNMRRALPHFFPESQKQLTYNTVTFAKNQVYTFDAFWLTKHKIYYEML